MAATEMSDFLSNVTADYTSEELTLSAQHSLGESGGKNQEVHIADDGSEERISYGDDSEFYVEYGYAGLTEADAGTIYDLYHNTAKANGVESSFYWHHPTDGHIYTVRFDGQIPRVIGPSWVHKFGKVRLRILGNKP